MIRLTLTAFMLSCASLASFAQQTWIDVTDAHIINPRFNNNDLTTGWEGTGFGSADPVENADGAEVPLRLRADARHRRGREGAGAGGASQVQPRKRRHRRDDLLRAGGAALGLRPHRHRLRRTHLRHPSGDRVERGAGHADGQQGRVREVRK